jgi:predicted  nucleic acid-binding Zn-ribbon protein
MNVPPSSDDLSRDPAAIHAELDRLEKRDTELQAALDDVEHDTRRCNDALERAGWRSGEAESRSAILAESRRSIADDRERNRVLHAQLTQRLALIRKHLNENVHND